MWVHENSPYVLFPFYEENPFWIGEWNIIIFVLISLLSFYTVFLWIKQMQIHRKPDRNKVNRSVAAHEPVNVRAWMDKFFRKRK